MMLIKSYLLIKFQQKQCSLLLLKQFIELLERGAKTQGRMEENGNCWCETKMNYLVSPESHIVPLTASVFIFKMWFFSLLQCTKMPLSIYLECDTKESLAVAHTFELVCFRSLTDQVWRSGRTLPALPLDKQLVLMLSMSPWDEPLPPTGAHLSFPRESQTWRESISPTPLPRTDVFLHLCLSKNDAESVASNTCRSHRTTVIL